MESNILDEFDRSQYSSERIIDPVEVLNRVVELKEGAKQKLIIAGISAGFVLASIFATDQIHHLAGVSTQGAILSHFIEYAFQTALPMAASSLATLGVRDISKADKMTKGLRDFLVEKRKTG